MYGGPIACAEICLAARLEDEPKILQPGDTAVRCCPRASGAYLAESMRDVLVGRPVAHRRCTTALWISGTSRRLFYLDDHGTTTAAHLRHPYPRPVELRLLQNACSPLRRLPAIAGTSQR
jgi:hypothetical protein